MGGRGGGGGQEGGGREFRGYRGLGSLRCGEYVSLTFLCF